MNPPPDARFRPIRRGRTRNRVALVGFFFVTLAFSVWFGPSDSERFRQLAELHQAKATECHRLERIARESGRAEVSQSLARSASNHEWFSRTYRDRSRILRDQWFRFF